MAGKTEELFINRKALTYLIKAAKTAQLSNFTFNTVWGKVAPYTICKLHAY